MNIYLNMIVNIGVALGVNMDIQIDVNRSEHGYVTVCEQGCENCLQFWSSTIKLYYILDGFHFC